MIISTYKILEERMKAKQVPSRQVVKIMQRPREVSTWLKHQRVTRLWLNRLTRVFSNG